MITKNKNIIAHTCLEGMIATVFTPLTKEDEVNLEMIDRYADWIVSATIQGVFVCDTIGESSSSTIEEGQQILARWIEVSKHRFRVITHVGSNCRKDFAQLACHTATCHADATASIALSFFRPDAVNGLMNYFRLVCEAAPETPFYYYNMLSITRMDLPVNESLTEGNKVVLDLVGVKFIYNSFMETQQRIDLENHLLEILNGFDEILIAGISIGVVAGVGSTYNYIPSVYQHVFDIIHKNNIAEARQWQLKSAGMVKLIIRYGGDVRGGEAIMGLISIDRGNYRFSLPTCTEGELACVRKGWEHLGIRP